MDIETRLRKLEARYRAASLSADAAKAHYFALAGEGSAPPPHSSGLMCSGRSSTCTSEPLLPNWASLKNSISRMVDGTRRR